MPLKQQKPKSFRGHSPLDLHQGPIRAPGPKPVTGFAASRSQCGLHPHINNLLGIQTLERGVICASCPGRHDH